MESGSGRTNKKNVQPVVALEEVRVLQLGLAPELGELQTDEPRGRQIRPGRRVVQPDEDADRGVVGAGVQMLQFHRDGVPVAARVPGQ